MITLCMFWCSRVLCLSIAASIPFHTKLAPPEAPAEAILNKKREVVLCIKMECFLLPVAGDAGEVVERRRAKDDLWTKSNNNNKNSK